MKKAYEKPLIEIEEFEAEDICTLSCKHSPSDDSGWGGINS
ncbi:hypothetical protein [Desulfosporosinus sp. FKA]|nr:hypothetical protein [Desulfosporosinus sp. FKA]